MIKYLTLVPDQKMNLESVLYLESFLMGHKQTPSYKPVYDFKTKMFGSLKAQRTSLVPSFMQLDRQWR